MHFGQREGPGATPTEHSHLPAGFIHAAIAFETLRQR
jgi:hypothetical protein